MAEKVKEVVWSAFAVSALQLIYDFIAEHSVREAEKQMDRIFDRTELLAKGWIEIGQRVEMNSRKVKTDYRYLVQDNYKIIYHEESVEIRIDLVFDTRQNSKKLKKLLFRK